MTYPSKPRQRLLDMYWQFAAERQAIFHRRRRGEFGSWTANPILAQYKFCNVYRAADRVSQYMIREVCQADHPSRADLYFNIVAFRTFSKPDTWDYLKRELGRLPRIEDLETGSFGELLDKRRDHGLYTAAFILCANKAYGHQFKHENHEALFHDMFIERGLSQSIDNARSFEAIYDALHAFPLMGDFMSYQTAIDLNYCDAVKFSENDFVVPGPGSIRGIKKAFPDAKPGQATDIIHCMMENQDAEFERLNLDFEDLGGRSLHLTDCQGLFCELDKYTRVAAPEIAGPRKRIKAKFSANVTPIDWRFPTDWNIRFEDQKPARPVAVPA